MTRQVDIKALVSHIIKGDGVDKCRICMGDTTEGQVYLGDTVMMDGDKPITLAELLKIITGVELCEEPLCPLGVCTVCVTMAIAAQELRILVLNSQKYWSTAVDSIGTIAPSVTQPTKSIYAFIRKENMSIQIVKNNANCDRKMSLAFLKNRIIKKKPKTTDKKLRVARTGPPCKCPDCGKYFASPYYLSLHLKNSGQKEACATCGAVLIKGEEMKEHLTCVHGETVFPCSVCPMLFVNELELKKHKKKAHRPGAFTCIDCGRTFPRAASLDSHSQMHTVRTCRLCGMQFSNRGCYRAHRSMCEPDARPDTQSIPRNKRSNIRDPATFTCDHCGKTYNSRPQLKNHILWIHMDIRPHQCQWCGKRFYTTGRLAEHTVVHTRERNFECDICGVKLVSKMAAVYHRRRHTGERPYKCEDCDEKFISASRRLEHAKRRHGKGLRYHCVECSAVFIRGHDLRKHTDKAHGKQNSMLMSNKR